MATKQRYQNVVIGDTVQLRMFVYNSNNTASVDDISEVKIYYLDPTQESEFNPDGRVLVETIPGASVVTVAQGEYLVNVDLTSYTNTGRYIDEWSVTFESGDSETQIYHLFTIYPDLWYTTPIPVVYDFDFRFQPNRFRYGTKKYMDIEIIPNVPRATDLEQYYENLAIVSDLKIYISQHCNECQPCESDLQLIVDGADTSYRERNHAFYFLDTTLFDCGVYDIYFQLEFGGSTYISETNQIQIYS